MSNYEAIRTLLNKISGQENVFTVPKVYVDFTGDLTTAVLLNQIIYLSDKSKRKDGYFYKTYKEWKEETCLTERQVRRSADKLKEMGFLETALKRANGSPTVHYKLHYDKLVDSILTFCQIPTEQSVSIQPDVLSETLTKNTTKNTTKKIPYAEIINYLNEVTNKKYRSSTANTKSLIRARWNDGFRLEDFKQVIDTKTKEWLHDSKMKKYLRPETLFSTKFEGYLNQENGAGQAASNEGYNSDSVSAEAFFD